MPRRGQIEASIQGQNMKSSSDQILTTHVGSLIRPAALQAIMRARQGGKLLRSYQSCLKESVAEAVRCQAEVGLDVISDGEYGKAISWNQYVVERLSGFELRAISPGLRPGVPGADRTRFKEFYAELDVREPMANDKLVACIGPVRYVGQAIVQRDIDNFAALADVDVEEAFMPVVAPSSVLPDRKDEHYRNEEEWLQAVTNAMRTSTG